MPGVQKSCEAPFEVTPSEAIVLVSRSSEPSFYRIRFYLKRARVIVWFLLYQVKLTVKVARQGSLRRFLELQMG
jgi:hypothetical protein